jgi:hypothetical protein
VALSRHPDGAPHVGDRHGTDDSTGATYLATTLLRPAFPDLLAVRTELWRRREPDRDAGAGARAVPGGRALAPAVGGRDPGSAATV